MSGRAQICHCGHDKGTHYEGKHNCLGMGCDPECRAFIDRDEPDRSGRTQRTPTTKPPPSSGFPAKPHADSSCRCAACLTWGHKQRGYGYSYRYP